MPEHSHLYFASQTGTGGFRQTIKEIDSELKGHRIMELDLLTDAKIFILGDSAWTKGVNK